MSMNTSTSELLVVGGGAAGMMAAITAAEAGVHVRILEKNDRPCRKIYITGKGRCNVTNNCSWQECIGQTPVGGKFLSSAMQSFPPEKTMAFFEALGCPLKTERGQRVFPVSDRAADIIDALRGRSRDLGIAVTPNVSAVSLLREDGHIKGVKTTGGDFFAQRVIFAVGGASYPRTGSTGDGYPILRKIGHTVTEPTGSLVPLEAEIPSELAGLSLRNVGVTLRRNGKTVYEDFGEAAFTETGLDGPTILSASAHMGRESGFNVYFDLKPALHTEKLEARLLRDLTK